MNNNMNNPNSSSSTNSYDQSNVDLSLKDVVTFIKNNLKYLLIWTLIGGVLSLFILISIPNQWESHALIRVGQLGVAEHNAKHNWNHLEPPLQVVDRLKSKSLQREVLKKLGVDGDSNFESFRDSLNVKLEKSELISLTLKATSPELARNEITTLVNELKKSHTVILAPIIGRWQEELEGIERELKDANNETNMIRNIFTGDRSESIKSFYQVALISSVLLSREKELQNFRMRREVLRDLLSPERTFSTTVLGEIEVTSEPVSPNKTVFIGAGLLLGLMLSVFFSVLRPRVLV